MKNINDAVEFINGMDQNSAAYAIMIILFLVTLVVIVVVLGLALDVLTKLIDHKIKVEENNINK